MYNRCANEHYLQKYDYKDQVAEMFLKNWFKASARAQDSRVRSKQTPPTKLSCSRVSLKVFSRLWSNDSVQGDVNFI